MEYAREGNVCLAVWPPENSRLFMFQIAPSIWNSIAYYRYVNNRDYQDRLKIVIKV